MYALSSASRGLNSRIADSEASQVRVLLIFLNWTCLFSKGAPLVCPTRQQADASSTESVWSRLMYTCISLLCNSQSSLADCLLPSQAWNIDLKSNVSLWPPHWLTIAAHMSCQNTICWHKVCEWGSCLRYVSTLPVTQRYFPIVNTVDQALCIATNVTKLFLGWCACNR